MQTHESVLRILVNLVVLLLVGVFSLNLLSGQAIAAGPEGVRILQSDAEGIVLELHVPTYTVQRVEVDDYTYQYLSIEGYGLSSTPGEPALPQRGLLLGIPAHAEANLKVLGVESAITGGFNAYPVPERSIESLDPGRVRLDQIPDSQVRFVKNQSIYATDTFFPPAVAEISDTGYLRDQRYVLVLVHPLQYNPVMRELKYHRYIKLHISFRYPQAPLSLASSRIESTSFEAMLKTSILNYETAKAWRSSPQPKVQTMNAGLDYLVPPSYKIPISQDGIYQLTYTDTLNAGIDVASVDPRTFKLYNEGTEVAIHVEGESDGQFNPSDYILFYGQRMDSKYTDINIYWLRHGETDGVRMDSKDGTPAGAASPAACRDTVHLEEDHFYTSYVPMQEGADHWYWNYYYPPGVPTQSYVTTLNSIFTDTNTCTLRLRIQGYSSDSVSPDHHLKLYVNEQFVGDAYWDGQTEYLGEHTFPQSYLVEGNNVVKIEAPNDTGASRDSGFINWFEIDYYDTYTAENDSLAFSGDEAGTWEYHVDGFTTSDIEVFDVTDPANVSRIVNAVVEPGSSYTLKFEHTITDRMEYIALTTAQRLSPVSIELDTPSDLHSTGNGADYIVITHADFYDEALLLANHRAEQGLRTMVVDVQDVYDEFSYGIFDAQAIHDFLAYAYALGNWQAPAPSYVLLVGDGNYDFKDKEGTGEPNYVPPFLAMVDPWIGETAADNRYACVNGSDILADMYIGRLPSQTSAQASAVVNKILNYEQNPATGDWNKQVFFVADNADAAGDFEELSEDIINNYLPSPYTPQKAYYGVTHSIPDDVKAAIIDNINDGRLLVNYIGHSAITYWAGEKFFGIDDIASLTNGDKLPVMLPMTCYEGHFIRPGFPCLGESIVTADGKGVVATWSPTGAGLATGHDYLNKGFFTAVFTDNISEIGPATYLGKLNLYTETGGEGSPFCDLIDTYVLFGDPFMKLNLPACDAADYDNDGRITVADVMQVAAHWDTQWGDANFDRKYDLDDDGDVDIVDVMWVAGRWEEVC